MQFDLINNELLGTIYAKEGEREGKKRVGSGERFSSLWNLFPIHYYIA
jgi:hypothetical protein